MNHTQRCVTGILVVVILGTIVAIQTMWLPKRSEAAPAARQAGRIAHNPAGNNAVVKAEGETKGK